MIFFFTLISLILSLISILYYGSKLRVVLYKNPNSSYQVEDIFFGLIIFYLLSFLINMFIPVYTEISLFITLIGCILFLMEKRRLNINLFTTVSIILTLIILFNYKPLLYDTKLYHIQGIEWIKNFKVTFGLTNINYRLGQVPFNWSVSSLLDISNIVIKSKFNLITFFILFFLSFKSFQQKKKKDSDYFLIIFFVLICLQYFKYSDLWNIFDSIASAETDIASGIYLTFGIYYFLKIFEKKDNYDLILITSLLLFISLSIKVTAFISAFVQLCLLYYLFFKNRKNLKKILLILVLLYSIFFIKNFINSGCIIFPISFTCFEPFWGIEINNPENKYSLKKYLDVAMSYSNETFNYQHIILRYFVILLIVLTFFIFVNFRKYIKILTSQNNYFKLLLIIYLLSIILFFMYIKNFRFNWYLFYHFLCFFYLILLKYYRFSLDKYLNIKTFNIVILLLFAQNFYLFFHKDEKVIYKYDSDYKIENSKNFVYKIGTNEGFCYNFLPPCSNFEINKKIEIKKIFGYNFYTNEN